MGILTGRKKKDKVNIAYMEHIVSAVAPGSIAEELEIEPGDVLVSVKVRNRRMFLITGI